MNNDNITSCPYEMPTTTINCGSTGTNVKWVLWQLIRHGYTIRLTGTYGRNTATAVGTYQRDNNLPVTYVADSVTCAALLR